MACQLICIANVGLPDGVGEGEGEGPGLTEGEGFGMGVPPGKVQEANKKLLRIIEIYEENLMDLNCNGRVLDSHVKNE